MNGFRIIAAGLIAVVLGVLVVFPLAVLSTTLSYASQGVDLVFDTFVDKMERLLDRISGV